MSQMSLLSVDASQTTDTQSGNGNLSKKNQTKSSTFSDAMEQHYPSKKTTGTDGKDKHDGNLMSKTATEQSPGHNDRNANVISKIKAAKEGDEHTLPVPIEVSDDADLTAKKSNDDAHTLPVPIVIEDDSVAPKMSPGDDAHTLPVPLPISLDDAALKEKSLADDNAHTLPVPVAPSSPENIAFQLGEKVRSNEANTQISSQNSSNNIITNTKSVSATLAENDDAVNLLKMLSGAGKLLTGASATQENTEQSDKKANANASMTNEQLVSAKVIDVGQQVRSNLTAEQKALASTGAESALLREANTVSSIKGATAMQNEAGVNVVEQKLANAQQIKNVGLTAQESSLVIDSKEKVMSGQGSEELDDSVVDEADKLAIVTTQKAVSTDANTDSNNGNNVVNNAVSDEVDNAQKQDVKQSIVVESQRVSEQIQNRTINQSTAAVVASNSNVKMDVEQSAMIKEAKEAADKSVSHDVTSEKLTKTDSEKQAPLAEKITSSFNQTLDAQAAKPTTSAGELAARQEQSFESSINSLTTNTVQAQKAVTALNTETIAIYRKDFANAVKDKVMVMINQKIQQVDIQLDPPEMGNVHVRVNLQNEQAVVQFIVQNQQAKEALEQNMGKLRDMLAENGVDVGDANIEQREAKEQNNSAFGNQAGGGQQGDSADEMLNDNNGSPLNMFKASSSGVDYYA